MINEVDNKNQPYMDETPEELFQWLTHAQDGSIPLFDYNQIKCSSSVGVDLYFELINRLPNEIQPGLLCSFGNRLYIDGRYNAFKTYLHHFCQYPEAMQLTALTLQYQQGRMIERMIYSHFQPLAISAFKDSPLLAHIAFEVIGDLNSSASARSFVELLIHNTNALHVYLNLLRGHPQEKRIYMLITDQSQKTIMGQYITQSNTPETLYNYLMCLGDIPLPIVIPKEKRQMVLMYIKNAINTEELHEVQRLAQMPESALYQFFSDTPILMRFIFTCLPFGESTYIQAIMALQKAFVPKKNDDEGHSLYFLSNLNANQGDRNFIESTYDGLRHRKKNQDVATFSSIMER